MHFTQKIQLFEAKIAPASFGVISARSPDAVRATGAQHE